MSGNIYSCLVGSEQTITQQQQSKRMGLLSGKDTLHCSKTPSYICLNEIFNNPVPLVRNNLGNMYAREVG